MLNCIVAACGQIGDMSRAFETFETFSNFSLKPDTGSYNAVLQGCVANNFLESVPKVRSNWGSGRQTLRLLEARSLSRSAAEASGSTYPMH